MASIMRTIEQEHHGMKLKDYMLEALNLSMRQVKAASKEKRLFLNGEMVRMDSRICRKDILEIRMREQENQNMVAQEMNLEILYEDDHLLAVNKPPGMLVHPTPNHPENTLTNGLLFYMNRKTSGSIVRLMNRLDRDTSGIVLIAKNSMSHMALAQEMESGRMVKTYQAVVHGICRPESGTIDLPIGKSDEDPVKRCVRPDGQTAITHYKTLETMPTACLVELTLETGRTHQIRVHLSHIGHSIYGDSLYGIQVDEGLIHRQALHACSLAFPHPATGEWMVLTAPFPKDMQALKERLMYCLRD